MCKFPRKSQFIKFDQRKEAFVHDTMTYGTWHLNPPPNDPYHTLEAFGWNIFGGEEHLLLWISFRFWDFLRVRQEQQEQLQIPLHIFRASPLNCWLIILKRNIFNTPTEKETSGPSVLDNSHQNEPRSSVSKRKAWKNLLLLKCCNFETL